MSRPHLTLVVLVALFLVGCRSTAPTQQADRAPLLDGLNVHSLPIATDVPMAQRYFDQGLVLAYGFNHAEAARSFREAQRLDPGCAMCYWGEALVLGPNINAPMDPAHNDAAWAALQTARQLIQTKEAPDLEVGARGPVRALPKPQQPTVPSEKERALIEALAFRYAERAPDDRSALDRAYADAMRTVAQQYPTDPDVQALFAEALMDTMPWDYWTESGDPKPETEEVLAALESAMGRAPYHPGANHFYIHAVESVHPERGLQAAERLDGRVPGAGHLVHMPGHIYIRVGRYHDAVRVNQQAAAADERYIAQCKAQGAVPLGYYPHNLHFLWFAALMGGEGAVAIETAEKIQATLSDDMLEVERLRPTLIFALVRFEKWDDLLALPAPPPDQLYHRAMWHYGHGLATLHTQGPNAATSDLDELTALAGREEVQALEQPYFHGLSQVQIAQKILQGEVAGMQGDQAATIASLREAVALQDALPYMEPPYWYYPVRQSLGEALLRAGRAAEAESVFQDDLAYFAENGWSLHGLAKSLRAQGRHREANNAQWRFERAWQHADIQLAQEAFTGGRQVLFAGDPSESVLRGGEAVRAGRVYSSPSASTSMATW
jgi:tetratricopeptide (TPR) repeat protein